MAFDPISAALEIGGKLCRHCGETKPITEYRWRNDNQKHRTICKSCESIVHHKKYLRKRTEVLASMKDWRESNLAAKLLKCAKDSAKRKGYEFNLDLSDIEIPMTCPYLGTVITNIQGKGFVGTNASIDRVNPALGYVKGNVQVISRRANSMKNDASAEELLIFAHQVLSIHGGKNGN